MDDNAIVSQSLFQTTTIDQLDTISINELTVLTELDLTGANLKVGGNDISNAELALLDGLTDEILTKTNTVAGVKNKALDDLSVTFSNTATPSKKARIDTSAVTAGQTRVVSVPDADVDLADVANNAAAIAINTTNIANNTSNIANNATDIATNASDLAAHEALSSNVHGVTGDVVGTQGAQTLYGKILSVCILNGYLKNDNYVYDDDSTKSGHLMFRESVGSGFNHYSLRAPTTIPSSLELTLPSATAADVLVGESTAADLTNKRLDSTNELDDIHVVNSAASGRILFYEDPANGSDYLAVQAPQSLSSSYAVYLPTPTGTDTLVSENAAATLIKKWVGGQAQCIMRLGTSQTGIGTSVTKINFDTSEEDNNSMVDAANKRINVQKSGYYSLAVQLYLTSVTTDEDIRCYVYKSGSPHRLSSVSGNSNATAYITYCFLVYCSSDSDYLEFYFYHSTGTININSTGAYYGTRVACFQVFTDDA